MCERVWSLIDADDYILEGFDGDLCIQSGCTYLPHTLSGGVDVRTHSRERGRRAEKVPEAKRMHDQGRVKGKG